LSAIDKYNKIPIVAKFGVVLALAVGVVAFFYFSVWAELDKKIQELESTRSSLQKQYEEQKAVADNLPVFQENTRKLEEDLANALKLLPRDKEIPSLLRDIYTLGRKSGIEFKSFEPQREVARQLYAEIPVKMTITGSYHEIAVFFDRIGKMSRIVNVSNLDITMQQKEDAAPQLTINCMATTFMFLGGQGS
jgi:type IV pilus assembly protein PilO